MSREIKYRAWHKEMKRMVGCYSQGYNMDYSNGQIYTNGMNVTSRLELMQYTGIKDKNGKEIFEGDIVKITGSYFRNNKFEVNFAVEYDESRAWFGVVDALHTVALNTFDYEKDVEVIGNIYENPELFSE